MNYKFDNFNNDWLVNLSNIDIPDKKKYILQLGQLFNLPNIVTNKDKIMFEFIKHIENNIIKLDDRTKNLIRKDSIPILNSIKYSSPNSSIDTLLNLGLKELKLFVTNHPNLLITRADKGNTTIILTINDYIYKIYEILSDNNTE